MDESKIQTKMDAVIDFILIKKLKEQSGAKDLC